MTPPRYSAIRPHPASSSDFQSWQFRRTEFLLDNKNAAMPRPHAHRARHHWCKSTRPGARRRCMATACGCWRGAARHSGAGRLGRARLDAAARRQCAGRSGQGGRSSRSTAALESVQPGEKLTDLEDALRLWRFRGVTTVESVIGFKRGTGGTSGVGYLCKLLAAVLFPEIWSLRTAP